MLKTKLGKNSFLGIGLFLYVTFIIIIFFFEVSTIFKLRSQNLSDVPNINFVPFNTILNYIFNFSHYNISTWVYNIFGNVLIFLPLGVFIPILFKNTNQYRNIIFFAFPLSAAIEILQYITLLGVLDVDDIILNLTGSLIGFYLYSRFKNKEGAS